MTSAGVRQEAHTYQVFWRDADATKELHRRKGLNYTPRGTRRGSSYIVERGNGGAPCYYPALRGIVVLSLRAGLWGRQILEGR